MYQQALISGIALGVAYGIMGLGFTLIYRSTRVINLAHGAVVMGVALTLTRWEIGNPFVRVVAAVLLGVVGMAAVHLVFMRPFMGSLPVARLSALVGAMFICGGLAQKVFGTDGHILKPFAEGHFTIPGMGGRGSTHQLISLLVVLAVVVALSVFFTRSMPGKSLRAIADDEDGARLVGIRTEWALLGGSMLAGGLAGLAAVIVAPQVGVSFLSGFEWTLVAVTTAIVGGITSEWGALAGGLVIGIAQGFMLVKAPEWFLTIEFGILILTLAFRPEGLFAGEAAIEGAR
ncbi:MAG TPA: branched-chain amino acid ABC transporter permease [Acidimicrobiales bacterium]|jgi:branched-chain amino acid transport system permease protein|nr:branched-chain amino acid ABC transporter permease [Acidimicrobiales bacterium]